LRVDEVAQYLDCTPEHVYNLIHDGTLIAQDINIVEGGRTIWRVSKSSLLDFMKRRVSGLKS